jgi:hypothetical protein
MSADANPLAGLRLSETDVQAILERAAAIETGTSTMSVDDLSSVAREAGISETAVFQAVWDLLEERRRRLQHAAEPAAPSPPAPARPSRLPTWLRAAGFGIGGTLAGAAAAAGGDGQAIFAACVVIVVSTFRAFRHRETGSQHDFQAELASVWGGFIAGFGWSEGYFDDDFVLGFGMVWLMSTAIGGLIVASKGIRRWRIFSLFRADRIEADPDRPASGGFVR